MKNSAFPGYSVAWLCLGALLGAGACSHAWGDLEAASGTMGSGGSGSTATGSTSNGGGGSGSTTSTSGSGSTNTSSTTSTSSGTGGTAPAPCGGTNILSWDFSSDDFDVFNRDSEGDVTGGEGILELPSNSSQDEGVSFWTYRRYDLRGDHVSLEITEMPNLMAGAWGGFLVHYDNGDDLYMDVWKGEIECGYHRGGNDNVPSTILYEPTQHRYWQIREDQGTVHCEVSPDGSSWSSAGSFSLASALLGPPSAVSVSIYAGTPSNVAMPGEFHFDNLNGGGPATGSWCKAATATDDFPDSSDLPGPAWNRSYTYGGASFDQHNDQLNFRTSSPDSGAGYGSTVSYDITGQRVAIQVLSVPSAEESGIFFGEGNNDAFEVYWDLDKDGASCSYDENGNSHTIWSGAPFNLPVWVSLRESGGKTFCEVYEGGMWKTLGSVTGVVDPTHVDVYMGIYTDWNLPTGDYVASFDKYNITPAP